MNFIKINSTTVKTYTLAIEEGEVRDQPYSSSGRRYRVTSIIVTKRDGNVDSVRLGGPFLKKDGTDSLNWNSELIYGRAWPEWLRGIIGGLA